ncbi:MAG: restriction endonuclease subunit S [Candidatus Gastranaerophilales bacterium]|nr:restriction endonuclease subunit S [Candidatus Gastranaerophilales bacterium]
MLQAVKWGKFTLGDLFEVEPYAKRFDANKVIVKDRGKYPYIVRTSSNNGQKGFIDENREFLNAENTISFGQDTATMFYQEKPYFTGDKIKVLKPKSGKFNKNNAQFFLAALRKPFELFSWGSSSFNVDIIKSQKIELPVKNGEIDFDFMESFIAQLEARYVAELETYLSVAGLKETSLSLEEKQALADFDKLEWGKFNLEALYGKSTRGKRLKSADRISGSLPFVTAGEADEGISDFIGNDVHVFSKNTTTIDMFGSAKYRSYEYGGDDHIAVVHTENLPMYAAIFVTTAIHKSSHNGQFDYGRNFYAKDADNLDIILPVKNGQPDYGTMETIISAIHKIVVKEVVSYSDKKSKTTRKVISSDS